MKYEVQTPGIPQRTAYYPKSGYCFVDGPDGRSHPVTVGAAVFYPTMADLRSAARRVGFVIEMGGKVSRRNDATP